MRKETFVDIFDRPSQGEHALLVHIDFFERADNRQPLSEFLELVKAASVDEVEHFIFKRFKPESKYYVGAGQAQILANKVEETLANLIIFNHDLTPSQERNLEKLCKARVLDRTGLILDIFSQRARSFEGRLQVELAQLEHLRTRLVRGWGHLERQRGGIGLRGPGETQLEVDRRLIGGRIKAIRRQLEKVTKQRQLSRRARKKANVPTISLVGYTNAGKSTLFNQLAKAHSFVADQLFATLDTTLRRIKLPGFGIFILADTVGFISQLPHDLIDAFHATLEETEQAVLLLHVVDASQSDRLDYIEEVNRVLASIHADEIPQLLVYNKVDLLSHIKPRIDRDESGKPWRVWISAIEGQGLELLIEALSELLDETFLDCEVCLLPEQGATLAALHDLGAIQKETILSSGYVHLVLRLTKAQYERLLLPFNYINS